MGDLKPFGSLSYKRPTEEFKQRFCFEVGGVIHRLKIDRQTPDLAVLSYIDANNQSTAFPQEFAVVDAGGQNALYLGNNFVLVWLNSYEVRYVNMTMLKISNQRQQSIFGAAAVQKGHTILPVLQQPQQAAVLEAEDVVLV